MQQIAAWLVARPLHAVLGLALTLILPFAQILSGAVMAALVLHGGARLAAMQGLITLSLLAVLSLVTGGSLPELLSNGLFAWPVVFLLAWLLRQSRSLTLTIQVSAVVAMLVTVGFHAIVDDPTAFWIEVLTDVAAAFRDMGFPEQADVFIAQKELIAPQMTILMVLTAWSISALVLVLGYALYQALPNRSGEFGRFCDLRFGQVVAIVMAVSSVLALIVGAEWLRNFAFVVFAIFWLQGLAMMHWLHVVGPLPIFVLVVIYVLMPILHAFLVIPLAVFGYTDTWFDYRARVGKRMAR